MDVTNFNGDGTSTTTTGVAWPNNGVLYVDNARHVRRASIPTDGQLRRGRRPAATSTSAGPTRKSLTIAAAQRHHHHADARAPSSTTAPPTPTWSRARARDATLGLIADNFVRVGHRVGPTRTATATTTRSTGEPIVTNVHDRGRDPLAQALVHRRQLQLRQARHADGHRRDRAEATAAPVGTVPAARRSSTGFTKNYWYDDRFRYRSPPYFLSPSTPPGTSSASTSRCRRARRRERPAGSVRPALRRAEPLTDLQVPIRRFSLTRTSG